MKPHTRFQICIATFSLVFGMESMLLVKFEVPFLKIAIDECLDNSQSLMDKLEKLENLSKDLQLLVEHVKIA
jgi:archaellum component FlaC